MPVFDRLDITNKSGHYNDGDKIIARLRELTNVYMYVTTRTSKRLNTQPRLTCLLKPRRAPALIYTTGDRSRPTTCPEDIGPTRPSGPSRLWTGESHAGVVREFPVT